MSTEADLVALRAKLSRLPEESPPPSLWLRIEAEHARQFPARRATRRRPALAAAAALLLALGVVSLLREPRPANGVQGPRSADSSPGGGLAPVAAPSQRAQPEPLPAATAAALRSLDRELQRLYLDGASDAAVAPLWRRREELLQRPDNPNPASQPVRI